MQRCHPCLPWAVSMTCLHCWRQDAGLDRLVTWYSALLPYVPPLIFFFGVTFVSLLFILAFSAQWRRLLVLTSGLLGSWFRYSSPWELWFSLELHTWFPPGRASSWPFHCQTSSSCSTTGNVAVVALVIIAIAIRVPWDSCCGPRSPVCKML